MEPLEIRHAVLVRASPERVYQALATAEGLDGWFTSGAAVDARAGGSITFRWRDWGPDRINGEDGGPVLEAEPGRRFVFQWCPDKNGEPTTVEVDFQPVPEGTIVRLREHGYAETESGRRRALECAAGWGEALTLLKFYVEHGIRY
ncbi:MAG TPA: SRPBCC domain-containing protein [Deinococcales bacterium]|nr:SRPBCC domain-containing protein [Deinococcales bacterium]